MHSIRNIIEEKDPTIIALVETKLSKGDELKIEGYCIERVDRDEEGGGVLIAYKECLENVVTVVGEETDGCEILWIKIDNGQVKLKMAAVYMPQESQTKIGKLRKI
jgi:exonuclease III